jgi:xanthine dehydrogenase/oxidase
MVQHTTAYEMALPTPPKTASNPPRALSAVEALTPLIQTTYTCSEITFYLNGRKKVLENPNPHWTLLDYIRAQPDLKGTKLGCGEGGCGACTVVLQVADTRFQERKIRHLSVNACLYPLVGVDGKHVILLKALATWTTHTHYMSASPNSMGASADSARPVLS